MWKKGYLEHCRHYIVPIRCTCQSGLAFLNYNLFNIQYVISGVSDEMSEGDIRALADCMVKLKLKVNFEIYIADRKAIL